MAARRWVVEQVLASAVATSGTFTVNYPSGSDPGTFANGWAHKMTALGANRSAPADFTVSFGAAASGITVTYLGTTTLPAGTTVRIEFDTAEEPAGGLVSVDKVALARTWLISLGAPVVNSSTAICASQSVTTTATINGGIASGGAATIPTPRNVVAAWTTSAVITVTGTDEYGVTVVESSASGTSFTGKKAFKTVTGVAFSTAVTGATVGTGNVLGLPVALPGTGYVLRELQDGAAPTAGTLVAAVRTAASATTGDVRGTYTPNATPDGAKAFQLICSLPSPNDKGVAQYGG